MKLLRTGISILLILSSSAENSSPDAPEPQGVTDNKERDDKAILDSMIPIWDGRIIISKPDRKKENEQKQNKQLKICITSNKELGICTRLSKCRGFKLSTLHNNICFVDIFVPGVCCSQSSEGPSTSAAETQVNKVSAVESEGSSDAEIYPELDFDPVSECGVHTIPSGRIINGNESPQGKWPWMAAIYTNTFLGRSFHCGGSLISSTHVLTGAHCVKDQRGSTLSASQIMVRLGDNDVNSVNDFSRDEKGRFHRVERITAHPKFRNINHYFMNDVAVLKLKDEVKFSDNVSPICLPPSSSANEPLDKFAGRMSTVTGYGRTELGVPSGKLLEAEVPIWKNDDCDASYFAPITDIFICAGFKSGGTDACQGDSGGPLQIEENNRWVQIGITSFGKGCGEAGFPGVYARLGKFVRWIRQNMNK